jgi:group I intron endonuclease
MDENIMLIYLIMNEITGKKYVGKTEYPTLENRWWLHQREVRLGSNYKIHCAMRKYGQEAFTIHILEDGITDKKFLSIREVFWIAELQTTKDEFGYNMTPGGDNPPNVTGQKRSAETCAIHSRQMKGNTFGKARKGCKHPDSAKRLIGDKQIAHMASLTPEERATNTANGRAVVNARREQGIKVGGAVKGRPLPKDVFLRRREKMKLRKIYSELGIKLPLPIRSYPVYLIG